MSRTKKDNSLLKETQQKIRNEKMLYFINKYKFIIIFIIIIIIALLISSFFYKSHLRNLADKNSLIFNQIQQDLSNSNNKDAVTLLNKLSKSGTIGYKLISHFQNASLAINDKDFSKAISILKEIKMLKVEQYYKDLADFIIFSIRLDNDKNLNSLSSDLKRVISNKENAFYYSDLELYSLTLLSLKQYNNALDIVNQIIDDDNTPNEIKSRSKSLKSVILAYVS